MRSGFTLRERVLRALLALDLRPGDGSVTGREILMQMNSFGLPAARRDAVLSGLLSEGLVAREARLYPGRGSYPSVFWGLTAKGRKEAAAKMLRSNT